MTDRELQLTVLGCRGSMAICREDSILFGGDTSCYMVRAGDETIFLDGGSGLIDAPTQFVKPPSILLSHFHLDHVLGLGMYPRFSQKGCETSIYLPGCSSMEGRALLDGIYSPPYWPLSLTEYAGVVKLLTLTDHFFIGDVQVKCMPGRHPGGSQIIRLDYAGRSLVYATDYEPDPEIEGELVAFARDADLLLFDGQYTEDEYPFKRGFGHSTAEKGLELMERSGVSRLVIIHHDPRSTDDELADREKHFGRPDVHYAREGETICL